MKGHAMPAYTVKLPISGYVMVNVDDAESAEAAIDQALATPPSTSSIEEWDVHQHIVQGNICFAILNSAEAQEIVE